MLLRISCLALLLSFTIGYNCRGQYITNPILAGFYPDPSICQAADGYYLINSSFAYYPGLPIFHSDDLLNWQQIGYVLNRPEQLDLSGAGISRGLFAPSIAYHKGLFYVVCTHIDKGGNFIVTAKHPKGPWSNPVYLPQINGIDPSLFFDDDGKTYIVYNSDPPNRKPLWNGHRTIRINEIDPVQLKVITDNSIIVNGGTDTTRKPVWIEGPHLLKKDGWYYLLCAEGGTGYNHSEVVFRSRSVHGPFQSYLHNPILTQRQLDPKRPDPVTTTGHADLVRDKDGKWWGIFLGCRPYKNDFYNTGRETFMAPVAWQEGWPVFDLGGEEVKYRYPINATRKNSGQRFSGNYTFTDLFRKKELNIRYTFLRTVRSKWYTVGGGKLIMQTRPETISGSQNPSFIGFRQAHLVGSATTGLEFTPANANERAGLVLLQSERSYYALVKTVSAGKPVLELIKGPGAENMKSEEILATIPLENGKEVFLKCEANGDTYTFCYAKHKDVWETVAKVDAEFLSTQVAGGFVGTIYGMYTTSSGQSSINQARFSFFKARNNDHIYR